MRHLRLDHWLQLKLMRFGTGEAGGKAILFGEHLVLHGSPAIALPVPSRRVRVTLTALAAPGLTYEGPGEGREVTLAMLRRLGVDGAHVTLAGDLPLAAGLGSSAALAVALVRATGVTDVEAVREAAHALEQIAHGRASGIDDAVISYASPLLFRPTAGPAERFTPLPWPSPPFWIAWVPRVCSTKESVARVAAAAQRDPALFQGLVASTAALVATGQAALAAGDLPRLGALMNEAQPILDTIGIVIDAHRSLCELGLRAGALGAKTTGAGGGGAVMFLGPRELALDRALAAAGFDHCFFAGEDL